MFPNNNNNTYPSSQSLHSEDNEAYVEDLLWEFSSSLAEVVVRTLSGLGFLPSSACSRGDTHDIYQARAEASIATFITQNQEIEVELLSTSYSLHNVSSSVLADLASVGVWACSPTRSAEQIQWLATRCLHNV